MPDALATLANAAGKLTRFGLHAAGRGATALPGLVTLQLDPDFIAAVTRSLPHGVALVSEAWSSLSRPLSAGTWP